MEERALRGMYWFWKVIRPAKEAVSVPMAWYEAMYEGVEGVS